MKFYRNQAGVIKSALDWVEYMGGMDVVIGRSIWGCPTDSLLADVMAEHGLVEVAS